MSDDRGTSRRTVLKRLGVGAGVAWTAPVLTGSMRLAGAQAGSPAAVGCAANCAELSEPGAVAFPCGTKPGCFCVTTVSGAQFCASAATADVRFGRCACHPEEACIDTGCFLGGTFACLQPC